MPPPTIDRRQYGVNALVAAHHVAEVKTRTPMASLSESRGRR
jgi:hypothetical protein